ncbi:MAG: flagellar protein FlgN [Thermaerobacterales bacterium]
MAAPVPVQADRDRGSALNKEGRALLAVLDAMAAAHGQLIDLAAEKTRILLNGDPDRLMALVAEEQGLTDQIKILEGRRGAVIDRLRVAGRADDSDRTMKDWIDLLEPQQGPLHAAFERFSDVLAELRAAHTLNMSMLGQALAYVHFSLKLLEGASWSSTYEGAGNLQDSVTRRRIDRRF